jgi:OOP family OmpA-OmpF porin
MRKAVIGWIISCCMVSLAAPSFAGVKAETYTVGPFIGGYTFDGVQHIKTRPGFGVRGGYNFTEHFGLEASLGDVVSVFTRDDSHDINVFNYRIDALYHFMPENRLVPFVAAGFGGQTIFFPQQKDRTRGVFDYGAGLKYFLTDTVVLRGDLRNLVFNERVGKESQMIFNYEYNVGVDFVFGGAKPAPAPVVAPPPAPVPPPPAPVPSAKLTANPESVTKGEQSTLAWTSQHATGCAIEPGIGSVASEGNKVVAPAETTTYTLNCSGAGGKASSAATVTVVPKRIKYCMPLHLEFDIDKAVIRTEYHDEVGRVAAFMKRYPTTTAVIDGHTDNVGTPEYNMGLSQRRAQAVVDYLVVKYGIDRSRLSAKGYGFTRPAAPNDTDANKQKNRRIEAMIDCTLMDADEYAKLPNYLCMTLEMEFDTDKADIKLVFRDEIGKLAEYMKKYPDTTATIEGHTDNVGGAVHNMKLSQRRADAVLNYLVEQFGIDRSRLSAKGYGETRPSAYNDSADGRKKNRRIEAVVDCVIKR